MASDSGGAGSEARRGIPVIGERHQSPASLPQASLAPIPMGVVVTRGGTPTMAERWMRVAAVAIATVLTARGAALAQTYGIDFRKWAKL